MNSPTETLPREAEALSLGETLRRVLKPVASLQLTVTLFVLSLLLVFFGTVAQIDSGIWTVVDKYFWSWTCMVPLDLFAKVGHVFFYLPKDVHFPGVFPFPAGKTLALLLCLNLLAAHALRFKLTWKRSGVMLIHSGLLVMLAGEVITREAALEQRMLIHEGTASSVAIDHRHSELAFTWKPEKGNPVVVAIPQSRLVKGALISHPELPVDVYVRDFMKNSQLKPAADRDNPATVGVGKEWIAEKLPEVSDLDNERKQDLPATYVELRKKGTSESLGTYLVSARAYQSSILDSVKAGDKDYELALQPVHYYKPFTVELLDFRFDKYVGTKKARNFSSLVRIIDPELGIDEQVLISMNNPLRHRGETFYQAGYDEENESFTILQVVKNPGWLLPYAACIVVGVGMLVHFLILLTAFLRKRSGPAQPWPTAAGGLTGWKKRLPWLAPLLVLIAFLGVAGRSMSVPGDGYDLDGFSKILVADGGRVKPMDTVARVYLRMMSRSEVLKDEAGNEKPAVKWLLDVMTAGDAKTRGPAWEYKTFYIENEHVLSLLQLKPRPRFTYTLSEIGPHIDPLHEAALKAEEKLDKHRTQDERKAIEARRKVEFFLGFNQGTAPLMLAIDPANDLWRNPAELHREIVREVAPAALAALGINQQQLQKMPPQQAKAIVDKIMGEVDERVAAIPAAGMWDRILKAYKANDPEKFNRAVADYRDYQKSLNVPWQSNGLEIPLNRMQPFYYVLGFYFAVIVLNLLGYLIGGWSEALRRAAMNVLLLTFIIHTIALIMRMMIQGRPPVTNLYSSAIYIGWGCAGIGYLLERLYRNGLGSLIGACLGFGASLIAHNLLGGNEDTLEMLQAVLDTNLWLATHVTLVTFGYIATYIAGAIGIGYLIAVIFIPSVTRTQAKDIGRMMYGVTCLAMLLSFVGTVLGGIWADQSWGRFWGWDPKENGAILLVIWNAMILHARWGGLVKDRGIAVLAILGGIITTWSWFGTNQLGVGLHDYGFSSELARLCLGVWIALTAIAAIGLLPKKYWASELKAS